jgi:hypothetical protein
MRTTDILLRVRVPWFLKVKTNANRMPLLSRNNQLSFPLSGKIKVELEFASGVLRLSPTGVTTAVNATVVY